MKNNKIDTNLELQHLIEHIKDSWENVSDLESIMTIAWTISLEKTKHMFDQYSFFEITEKIEEKRKDPKKWSHLPKEYLDYIPTYDAIYKIGRDLIMGSSQLDRIIMRDWKYENVCTEIEKAIKETYDIKKLKPIGWTKLSKNYSDFDGMEEYDQKSVNKKFKGIDSGGPVSGNFTYRTSLAQVMYDDKCQGRKPFNTLVGSIVAHAYAVSKRNNTIEMINDIKCITDYYFKPEFFAKIVLNIDTTPFVKNNTLKALLAIRNKNPVSQEEFEKIVKDRKEEKTKFEALSPEDKKMVLDERQKNFEKLMTSFQISNQTKEEILQEKREEQAQYDLCMSILNTSTKKKAKP